MDNSQKKEIIYFQCEKELKAEFYKMVQDRELSPGSLFRAFMRKAVKTWTEEQDTEKNKGKKIKDKNVE